MRGSQAELASPETSSCGRAWASSVPPAATRWCCAAFWSLIARRDRKELLRLLAGMHGTLNDRYGVELVLCREGGLPVAELLLELLRAHPHDVHVVPNVTAMLGTLCLGEHDRSTPSGEVPGGDGGRRGDAHRGSSGAGSSGDSGADLGPVTAAVLEQSWLLRLLADSTFDLSVRGGALRQAPIEFVVCLAQSRAAFDRLIGNARLERTLVASMLPALTAVGTPLQAAAVEFFHLACSHRPGYLGGHDFDWLLAAGFKVLGEESVNRVFNNVLEGLLQAAAHRGRPPVNNSFTMQDQPLKAARLLRSFVCDLRWPGAEEWAKEAHGDIDAARRRLGGEAARCLLDVLQRLRLS
ncbi:hypothetical protein ABPG75_010122 [Micractinium tetrahymenae]